MIDKIIRFSINNKFIVGLFILVLIGAGIYSMMTLKLGSVPDITNNQVQVITVAPNLGTEDIEQFITYPIELAVANLPSVKELRSVSRFGLSVVTIVFKDEMGTLPPQNKASISAIIGGRVQSVAVIEGDYVKKGQIIAQRNNSEFIVMQQKYLSAKSQISFLEKEYQRKKELLKDGITSKKSFQQAEAAYNEIKLALNAAKSNLELVGINISALANNQIVTAAPVISLIDGYVQNIELNIGKFVAPEKEMFEIIDNEYLHLGLKIFE